MLTDPNFIKEFTDGQEQESQEEEKAEIMEEVKERTKSGTVIDMDTKNMIEQHKGHLKDVKIDFSKLKMDVKEFYPHKSLFEMMIPRELLKKNLGLKKIHKLVMDMADAGLITR